MEPDAAFQKTFTIYQKHLEYLKNINGDNISAGLRDILDNSIDNDRKLLRQRQMDRTIMWSCFGAIFLLISYLLTFPVNIVSIGIGTLLFSYGTLGGVLFALRRT